MEAGSQGTIESIGNNLRLMRPHPRQYFGVVCRECTSSISSCEPDERQQ
jgi:hypothetical protein